MYNHTSISSPRSVPLFLNKNDAYKSWRNHYIQSANGENVDEDLDENIYNGVDDCNEKDDSNEIQSCRITINTVIIKFNKNLVTNRVIGFVQKLYPTV